MICPNRKTITSLVLTALLALGMVGCGGGGPQLQEDPALVLRPTVVPFYDGEEGVYEVDISMDICDATEEDITVEDFFRHAAELQLQVETLGNDPVQSMIIDHYKVEFTNLVPGTPPIEAYERFVSFNTSVSGAYQFPIDFIDLDRKLTLLEDYLSQEYPNATGTAGCSGIGGAGENLSFLACLQSNNYPAYAAHYTFYGSTVWGEDVKFEANSEFVVGNFSNCD